MRIPTCPDARQIRHQAWARIPHGQMGFMTAVQNHKHFGAGGWYGLCITDLAAPAGCPGFVAGDAEANEDPLRRHTA